MWNMYSLDKHITGTFWASPPHHPIPSSLSTAALGLRLFIRAAFPFTRAMDSCWKRCLVVVDSSSPVCLASRLPSFFTSRIAGLCQAPRLSTASGKKTIPSWLQGAQLLSIFRLWATVRAYPGVWAAWLTSAACRGFTTVREACLPENE